VTSAEQYAQKRIEAESLIRTHAPERLQSALIGLLRPAIALTTKRFVAEAIPLGASKFGGAPDVPEDFVWPTWNEKPLGFLAQINLEEVAPFDVENQLPKSGLLSFFYFLSNGDEWPIGEAKEKEGWRVFHFVDKQLARRSVPPDSLNEYPFAIARFETGARWTAPELPDGCWPLTEQEGEEWGNYSDVASWNQSLHQILGNPKIVQYDVRYDAAKKSQRGEEQDWILLLQIDSDNTFDFMWGDLGTLYFLIHQADLKTQDFSNVWCIADCS
jgi:uncharacterized protein YwqG